MPEHPAGLDFIIGVIIIILAAGLGLWLDVRRSSALRLIHDTDQTYKSSDKEIPSTTQSHRLPESQRLEAEIFQLNQDLLSRYQEQTNELAHLNIELQLQMAMHKKAEEVAHTNEERFRNMADNIQEGLTIIENGRLIYRKRTCMRDLWKLP